MSARSATAAAGLQPASKERLHEGAGRAERERREHRDEDAACGRSYCPSGVVRLTVLWSRDKESNCFLPLTRLRLLDFTVALANTHPSASRSGLDEMSTPAELTALVDSYKLLWTLRSRLPRNSPRCRKRTRADSARSVASRPRRRGCPEVNRMMRDANAHALSGPPRQRSTGTCMRQPRTTLPLAERIKVEVGLALFDVIRSDEMHRMRPCDAPTARGCSSTCRATARSGSAACGAATG